MTWARKVLKNGKMILSRRDKNGKLHGQPSLIKYNQYGLLEQVDCHEHGILHSISGIPTTTAWHDDGTLYYQSYRQNGRFHGLHAYVHCDNKGRLFIVRSYKNGRIYAYDDVPSHIKYHEGNVVWQTWGGTGNYHRPDPSLPIRLEWRPDGEDLFIGWRPGSGRGINTPKYVYFCGDGTENAHYNAHVENRPARDYNLDQYKWEGEISLHNANQLGELYGIDLYDV